MVVTPNPAQSPTHFAGPLAQNPADQNPAVLNLRRPGALLGGSTTSAALDANIVLASVVDDDNALPPTVLRLPHLAAAGSSRNYSIASIAHWVAIVLGGIIALALIFTGRGKPLEEPDKPGSTAPAPADSTPGWKAPLLSSAGDSSAPSWNPPPLSSAGESAAPKWTPPAAATPAPTQEMPSTAPAAHEHDHAPAGEAPAHEAWPKGEASEPAPSQPELPTMPESTARYAPIGAGAGPAYRTAQREAPLVDQYAPSADDDAQPLGITVPVPQ